MVALFIGKSSKYTNGGAVSLPVSSFDMMMQTSMGRTRLDVCPMIGEYGLPEWVLRIAH